MKIDKFIDEFNLLEQQNKIKYLADLQKKADNGDMTALFLTGDLQFPPDWAVMKKAALSGDPELYYACICAKTADFGISPAKEREIHQLCYRGRKMNYAPVLNRLAITYLCGIGCKQNIKLAKKYFTQATELGMELAQENLDYLTSHNDPEVWANIQTAFCDNKPSAPESFPRYRFYHKKTKCVRFFCHFCQKNLPFIA